MNKKFNKALSLILALMLVFSVIPFAFAADSYTYDDLTQEEVEKIALEYLTFKDQTSYVYDTEYNYSPAYKVISTVVLANNKVVTFVCYIDKYTSLTLLRIKLDLNAFICAIILRLELIQNTLLPLISRRRSNAALTSQLIRNSIKLLQPKFGSRTLNCKYDFLGEFINQ